MNVHITVSHEQTLPSGRKVVVADTAVIFAEKHDEDLPDVNRVIKDLVQSVNYRLAWELTLDKMNVPYPRTDNE